MERLNKKEISLALALAIGALAFLGAPERVAPEITPEIIELIEGGGAVSLPEMPQ